jgi:hypothetical protein
MLSIRFETMPLGAKPAGVLKHGSAVPGNVFIEKDALLTIALD